MDFLKYNTYKSLVENTIYSKDEGINNTNLITDLLVGMLLINPSFLDPILDKGNRSRYTQDTSVFLTDLKNLLMRHHKLVLGKKNNLRYSKDSDIGTFNSYFNKYSSHFDMEKDWTKLVKCRDIAINISKKILKDEHLTPEVIRFVYFLGPNREDKADLVLETGDGRQYPIALNSKFPFNNTHNFTKIYSLLIGKDINIFEEPYKDKWNRLAINWIKTVYFNANVDVRLMIDEFIEISRVDSILYHEYFDIEIRDSKYKNLGKLFEPLNKNYKYLHEFLTDVYKDGNLFTKSAEEIYEKWNSIKRLNLSSGIIEHAMIEGFKKVIEDKLEKTTEGYYIANESIKMRFMRVLVTSMKSADLDVYFFDNKQMTINKAKKWFRENYKSFKVFFKYHTSIDDTDRNGNIIDVKYMFKEKELITVNIETNFGVNEMGGKLKSKTKITLASDYNYKIM